MSYLNLPQFILNYPNLSWFTSIYHDLPQFNLIYLNLTWSTSIYLDLPQFTMIYLNLPQFTMIYLNLTWFTSCGVFRDIKYSPPPYGLARWPGMRRRAFAAWSKPLRILAQPAVCILYPVCELIACTSFMLCLATASWWNTHFRSCYVCVCYAHNILTNKHSFHKIFEPWNRTVLETWLKWLRVNFLNSMNHPFLSIFSLKKCILI